MSFKVEINKWHAVGVWTWEAGDDMCGICRNPFDGCPPESKFPGDDSPVVWGTCGHAFHLQVGLLRLVLVLVVVLVWAQLLFGDKAACCCV
jgi:anaphase-promoting complex subunit 11